MRSRPEKQLRPEMPRQASVRAEGVMAPPLGDRSLAFQVSGVQTSRLQAQDPSALGRSL